MKEGVTINFNAPIINKGGTIAGDIINPVFHFPAESKEEIEAELKSIIDLPLGEVKTVQTVIPAVLDTPEARRLWAIARQNGWVDEELQPCMSQPKSAILASVIADCLNLSPKWPPFEDLWDISDLANKLSHAQLKNYYSDIYRAYIDKLI